MDKINYPILKIEPYICKHIEEILENSNLNKMERMKVVIARLKNQEQSKCVQKT